MCDEKGSYCRLNGNILKLTKMPDSLYELVEENANFVAQERTETAPIHRNSETQRIPGDINIALRQLGFSGIYWTTSYGFKCDQNAGECPLCGKFHTIRITFASANTNQRAIGTSPTSVANVARPNFPGHENKLQVLPSCCENR